MNNHRFVNHALDLKPASGLTKPDKDHRMTESETEAETIDRLEVALRKIAAANAAVMASVTVSLPAAGPLGGRRHAVPNIAARRREFGFQAAKRIARCLLFVDRGQRPGEAEQRVLRPGTLA